ncbi:MAG TPA: crosslink repair DNA glycosylase YcaQ family protein [Gaiellaceae bacterium]|nr:crosslink repair DNA glycosylase YcaQ family protein [Gaiellaceae bacterium]
MSETNGVEVTRDEARRIAVRAQLLDGSARGVLETVRRLRYLQLDPISTVAPPQHLVLFSRLGNAYDRAELDRLLWDERQLIEWRAFLWPADDLPYLRARMRRRSPQGLEYIKENAGFRRYVLRELERRGPLLSREIETHSSMNLERHDWWGTRKVGLMLEVLAARGEVAVVGRRGKQRVWDLAERWYPESETLTWAQAERVAEERRLRALGVVRDKRKDRWLAYPDATDGPMPDRATLLSPFDRLIHDRERTEALWDFYYRLEMYVPKAKREHGYYVLPLLVGDRLVGRAEPVFDAKSKTLRVLGAWGDTSRLPEALDDLAAWLGAERVEG